MKYVKSEEYAEYTYERKATSTIKASVQTVEPKVEKNDLDIPKYQYHEVWVSYKGADGKCYKVAVYASYTYKGGGVYAKVPSWSSDYPEEMACANASK